jgi:hypothetical protein
MTNTPGCPRKFSAKRDVTFVPAVSEDLKKLFHKLTEVIADDKGLALKIAD